MAILESSPVHSIQKGGSGAARDSSRPPLNIAEELVDELDGIDLNDPQALERGTLLLQKLAGMYEPPLEPAAAQHSRLAVRLSNALNVAEIPVSGELWGTAIDPHADFIATVSRPPRSQELDVKVQKPGFEQYASVYQLSIENWIGAQKHVDMKLSTDGSTLAFQNNQQTIIFKVSPDQAGLPRFQGAPLVLPHSFATAIGLAISDDGSHFLRFGKGERGSSNKQNYTLEYGSLTPNAPFTSIEEKEPITSAIFTGNDRFIYATKELVKVPAGALNLFARIYGDGTVEKLHTVLRRVDLQANTNTLIFSERNLPDLHLLSWQAGDQILAIHSRGLLRIQDGKADQLMSFKKEEITPELVRAAGATLVVPERIYTFQSIGYGRTGWHSGKQVSTVYRMDQSGNYAESGKCEDPTLKSALDRLAIGVSANGKFVALHGRAGKEDRIGIYRV